MTRSWSGPSTAPAKEISTQTVTRFSLKIPAAGVQSHFISAVNRGWAMKILSSNSNPLLTYLVPFAMLTKKERGKRTAQGLESPKELPEMTAKMDISTGILIDLRVH